MAGLILEQHPDRARLFMQWKRMEWPVMVDPLNVLGVTAVPLTLLIDESGIVWAIRPGEDDLKRFLNEGEEPAKDAASPATPGPPDIAALERAASTGEAEALRRYADALVLWGGTEGVAKAIAAYEQVLQPQPGDGATHFHLGVAYRMRYDGPARRRGDFRRAVEHWSAALDIDPNQYIWRRRIQQYGPRLAKPYPFYDWVETARREIRARGEEPSPLSVEPAGAELAPPAKSFLRSDAGAREPDPKGRIHRDAEGLVEVDAVVVPAHPAAGGSARLHVVFRPNLDKKAHWNNEVDDLLFWVDPPSGWEVDRRLTRVPRPPRVVSQEERRVEVEVRIPPGQRAGKTEVKGYALYYVCEDVDGTCLFRRQDVTIPIELR